MSLIGPRSPAWLWIRGFGRTGQGPVSFLVARELEKTFSGNPETIRRCGAVRDHVGPSHRSGLSGSASSRLRDPLQRMHGHSATIYSWSVVAFREKSVDRRSGGSHALTAAGRVCWDSRLCW